MLPTTLRRLAEAAATATIAPIIEPTFSSWQAARRGGSCRENVSLALAHLDGAHTEPLTAFLGQDERRDLRQALLGPAADAWSRDEPGAQPTGRA
eukprot:8691418-Alexandrium_andersonii.AAC.1